MKIILNIVGFLSFYFPGYAQKYNKSWYTGHTINNMDTSQIDTGIYKNYGSNIIKFQPFSLNREFKALDLFYNVVNMCDNSGNMLFYSNGSKIFNSKHRLIENGDSLNYSKDWSNSGYYSSFGIGYYARSMIAIHDPYIKNKYYIFSTYYDWGNSYSDNRLFTRIMYSVLDMSENNGEGKLILKEKTILEGNFCQGINAVKKSNGKDWWILIKTMDSSSNFVNISVDSLGVELVPINNSIGFNLYSKDDTTLSENHFWTGGNFSQDGKKFCFLSDKGVEVFNFNRCTGELTSGFTHSYPDLDTSLKKNENNRDMPIFSPNNQYLYVIYATRIYQYDLLSANTKLSITKIADYDGHYDIYTKGTDTFKSLSRFYFPQLAIDGKIYLGTDYFNRYLHCINSPDMKGNLCDFKQHFLKLSIYKSGLPYYPNYSLGEDYSSCWRVGIQSTNISEQISVFPNPARDYVIVNSEKLKMNNECNIEIWDIMGRLVKNEKMMLNNKVDVRGLVNGLYLMKIMDKKGVVSQSKFEVNR